MAMFFGVKDLEVWEQVAIRHRSGTMTAHKDNFSGPGVPDAVAARACVVQQGDTKSL